MNRLFAVTISVVLAMTSAAYAQFPPDTDGNLNDDAGRADDQSRAVARISVINGDVSVRRGDSGEVVAAALNAPLVVQDRLITNEGSRAEVQFDSSNMIRVGQAAEVRLAELEYNRYLIQVARGTVMYRVLRDMTADVELATPTVSVRPVNRSAVRITVRDDGTTEITVRAGEVDIFTPRGSERLSAGRTMLARGTPADPEVQVLGAIRMDEWDQWNERRDKDLERSQSGQYVSRDIYGTEDLDNNGRWVPDPEYGNVWAPYATAGWAPYRNGRWVWVDYYGWSWVSYDPWGWAPYHYGRWFYRSSFGWCWYPGERQGRHYWSPALVAFVGFGGRGGGGIGFGNVGWIPLGPHEPYYRGYGRGVYGGFRNGGDRRVNLVNNVNITNVYRNSRVNNGITAIDHNSFGRGRVSNNIRVSPDDLNRASLVRGQLPVAPGRESLRMSDREVGNVRPGAENARFSNRRPVAQVDRVPFEEQRRGMEQVSRRTFGDTGSRGSAAVVPQVEQPGRGSVSQPSPSGDGGWRRFGDASGRGQAGVQPAQPAAESRRGNSSYGWRNLGNTPSRGNVETPRAEQRQAPRQDRQDRVRSPEQRYQAPVVETPRSRNDSGSRGFNRGESIRISPPIVRERTPERSVERSAPRYEPRQERNNGGGNGGGGGGRSEGRGGGGGHSDGGGRGGRGR